MTPCKHILPLLSALLLGLGASAQHSPEVSDFYAQMARYDLSQMLMEETPTDEEGDEYGRPPILAFLGDDYWRLQIRFISIVKDIDNPHRYFAYGKTRFKGNICEFQGTITIREAELQRHELDYVLTRCDVVLYEDRKQRGTGVFRGKLESDFVVDDQGHTRYVGDIYSDSYYNNQFVGTWTNYRTGEVKPTHWGDYDMPDPGPLGSGDGCCWFPAAEYVKNGWESFMGLNKLYRQYSDDMDNPAFKRALREEYDWWR